LQDFFELSESQKTLMLKTNKIEFPTPNATVNKYQIKSEQMHIK